MAQKVVKRNGPSRFWNAEDYSAFMSDFLVDGIADQSGDGSDLQVSEQSPQAMGVYVAAGRAYMNVTVSGMNYKERIENLVQASLDVNANATGGTRVDAVIARIDVDVLPDVNATNMGSVEVIVGTGNTALSDAYIQSQIGSDSFIRLADIAVPNGASSITDAYITDQRTRCTLSGFNTLYGDNILPIASGVNVNGFEFREDACEVTEKASNPSAPVTGNWKLFFKADGAYILDDLGNATKVQLGGSTTESKAEASASNGELFQNTDDANTLSWKDNSGVVHNVVLADNITSQAGAGSATPSNEADDSGNIDIDIAPFTSTDILEVSYTVALALASSDNPGNLRYARGLFKRYGRVGGAQEGESFHGTFETADYKVYANAHPTPTGTDSPGNMTQSISGTPKAIGTVTISPPTIDGTNLRFAWDSNLTITSPGFCSVGISISAKVTRLSKKA